MSEPLREETLVAAAVRGDLTTITAEAQRARASETEKAAEIERLKADVAELREQVSDTAKAWSAESLRADAARLTPTSDIKAASPEGVLTLEAERWHLAAIECPPDVRERLKTHVDALRRRCSTSEEQLSTQHEYTERVRREHQERIAELEAVLARLTPSGQVAEDVERARAKIAAALGEHGRALECHGALSMLSAKAQGYEAMQAERDAALARAEEAEKQSRYAWTRHAEKDRAYGDMIAQRDAVVADNAALMEWIDQHGHAEWCQRSGEKSVQCTPGCLAFPLFYAPMAHPGSALLKERQEREEVVKALGAFLASVQHVGPKGCPAGECGLCDALRLAGVLP